MTESPSPTRQAVIALGANVGDAVITLRQAIAAIAALPLVAAVQACSQIYRSQPAHVLDQPDFANAIVIVQLTPDCTPTALLAALQDIELSCEPKRHEHWQPRHLDLDIIDFSGVCLDTATLKLPHPYARLRDFVVTPLLEVAPDYVLADGQPVTREAVAYGAVTGLYEPDAVGSTSVLAPPVFSASDVDSAVTPFGLSVATDTAAHE